MFYTFKNTIGTGDVIGEPIIQTLDLITGIIHQVDILFEDGCNHEAHVQIFQAKTQIWPTNDGATIVGNATVVSFREFFEIRPGATDLQLHVWGDGVIDDVDVILQLGLLPKRVLQPLSFKELLVAATGMKE